MWYFQRQTKEWFSHLCLRALINKNKQTYYCKFFLCPFGMYMYPLQPRVSFSGTWKPFLWNVISRKDGAPVSCSLWEDRILTSIRASWKAQLASRQPWPWPLTPFLVMFHFPDCAWASAHHALHSPRSSFKAPVTPSPIQGGLSFLLQEVSLNKTLLPPWTSIQLYLWQTAVVSWKTFCWIAVYG